MGFQEREAERNLLDNPDQYEADITIWFGIVSSMVVIAVAAYAACRAGRDLGHGPLRTMTAVVVGTVVVIGLCAAFSIADRRI